MRFAHKIFNRLRREIRYQTTYTRARFYKTNITAKDVLHAWRRSSSPSTLSQCIREWIDDKPCVFDSDLKPSASNQDLILKEADTLLLGRITIFQKTFSTKLPSIWHEDPLTHQSWDSHVHFTRFNVFHPSRDGITDIRRIWEIGRFGWALPLAQAFAMTGDPKYSKAWNHYVQSFIETNPPEFGPHWLNAMEVAIRTIQWCRALALLFSKNQNSHSPFDLQTSALKWILPSLLAHGRYIHSHMEWTPSGRTNHYIADLVGLLLLSIFIPQFREAKEWHRLAKKKIIQEIDIQTDFDGFHAEASTSYHHFVLELYTLAAAIDRQHHLGFPFHFHKRVEQIWKTDQVICGSEGINPRIGDDDSGTLHLNAECGVRNAEFKNFSLQNKSHALHASGIYILRSSALSCHVTCGPNGQQGVGGHAHNDKLSIVLHFKGSPIIVDSGTFCYTADIQARDQYRSTMMHNTIVVNGQEQNPLKDWRMLKDRTAARCLAWKDSAHETFFWGEHLGYQKQNVIHRRTIQLDKRRHRLLFLDELQTKGTHSFDFYLHLAPWLTRGKIDSKPGMLTLPDAKLIFQEEVQAEILNTMYSPTYGQQIPNLTLHFKVRAHGIWEFRWEFRKEV